ncbi:hypothetical protein D3C77_626670 [compost metagenome]
MRMGLVIGVARPRGRSEVLQSLEEPTEIKRDELLGRIDDFILDVDVLGVLPAISGIQRMFAGIAGDI